MHDIKTAVIIAVAGLAVLAARCVAVRHAGLAPTHRGAALACGVILGLAAFGLGMTGNLPMLGGGVLGELFLMVQVSHRNVSLIIEATALIECLAALLSCSGSRLRQRSAPPCPSP